mmetsp:Transcript_6547/g.10174  ORF Transcript_6547/g.10174 Transcript_6547/m.10174 type:complete len:82 (+) Transcript_6547:1-246(+)
MNFTLQTIYHKTYGLPDCQNITLTAPDQFIENHPLRFSGYSQAAPTKNCLRKLHQDLFRGLVAAEDAFSKELFFSVFVYLS